MATEQVAIVMILTCFPGSTLTGHLAYAPAFKAPDNYAQPSYKFNYGVKDPHTGDLKSQWEVRDGDVVKGSYSLVDADGFVRTVEYTADKVNGFNAVVKKTGAGQHAVGAAKPALPRPVAVSVASAHPRVQPLPLPRSRSQPQTLQSLYGGFSLARQPQQQPQQQQQRQQPVDYEQLHSARLVNAASAAFGGTLPGTTRQATNPGPVLFPVNAEDQTPAPPRNVPQQFALYQQGSAAVRVGGAVAAVNAAYDTLYGLNLGGVPTAPTPPPPPPPTPTPAPAPLQQKAFSRGRY